MKKLTPLTPILILCLLTSSMGQTTLPATQQGQSGETEVVRITTNLVQLDAVVTDKSGQQVTNLRPEDFEILEDGRPQGITNLSYISIQPVAERSSPSTKPSAVKTIAPPTPLRSEQVRRTIVLVVDDLGMSFADMRFVQHALKKFVDEQSQPGDLVGIVMTGGGGSALQQFTNDKRQLYAAIERVRWQHPGRIGVDINSPLKSLDPTLLEKTINALTSIVTGMKSLPGRKSVLFFTEDFPIFKKVEGLNPVTGNLDRDMDSMLEEIEQRAIDLSESVGQSLGQYPNRVAELIDRANQASVVIYTIDARGLMTLGMTAEERGKDAFMPSDFEEFRDKSRAKLLDTQFGLGYLASQTGGFLIHNANDMSGAIKRVLDDQNGYYLIGYHPPEETFKANAGQFHKVEVRVKRPGLRVHSRKGFYSLPEENKRPIPLARNEQLKTALNSPFDSPGVRLRSTAMFGNTQQSGSFIRLFLHIDGHDLSFKEEADGWHSAVIDIVAQAYTGGVGNADTLARTETIRMQGKSYERALREGLVYVLNVPVKMPGAHQLRVAVRDVASERIGSARQFVEVPNLTKNELALSGIAISGSAPPTPMSPRNNADEESGESALEAQSGPARRRLQQGMMLNYGFIVYNAKADAKARIPQIQTQVLLFKDGKLVYEGAAKPFDASGQNDTQRLVSSGRLYLGADLAPGEYLLQVVVTDLRADAKHNVVTQWADFEIVK
jgi:VWFA-related protein